MFVIILQIGYNYMIFVNLKISDNQQRKHVRVLSY